MICIQKSQRIIFKEHFHFIFEEINSQSRRSCCEIFLSQVLPGMSLSRVTLPTFILETKSTIQRFLWMFHTDLFCKIPEETDEIGRCFFWFSSWIKIIKKKHIIFEGWSTESYTHKHWWFNWCGVMKQNKFFISHHPPISVFHLWSHRDEIKNSM